VGAGTDDSGTRSVAADRVTLQRRSGAPRYATWWSPCDDIVNPDDSVLLVSATNNKTACVSHTALPSDLAVYQAVRAFVNQ
jgi:hypothetical protein